MKNVLNLFSTTNSFFIHKLMACAILFCIILGSIEFVPVKYDISFLKTAKISSDTVINHLFSLSSFTINAISKLFMQTEQFSNNDVEKSKNENKTKKEKTSKEASSFSLLPINFSCNFMVDKSASKLKYSAQSLIEQVYNFKFLTRDFARSVKEFTLLNIMLFLLMMFLIKKNTSSDNYNSIKLKNICFSLA